MTASLSFSFPYLGETCAVVTAVTWAFAVILFKKCGETVHPVALNAFKNILGLALIVPTMALLGEPLLRNVPASEYLILFVSGALGIGISDTLFFKSLNLLGAGLSAIVDCLYSPFVIGTSMLWLGERLTVWQVVGVIMIVSAVLTATTRDKNSRLTRKQLWLGIMYGALAMAVNAIGIVMVKPLLNRSPLFWVSAYRLAGGLMVLAIVLALNPRRKAICATVMSRVSLKYTVSGALIGTYLALFLWLAGMKFTQASIAAALNQTSNIFIFIFAAIFLHEPINRQRTIGIILGVAGAIIVTFT